MREGKPRSAECRLKISLALKGKPFSPERRAAISKALKGREFTSEHKTNISKAKAGCEHTQEHRRKISATLKIKRIKPPSREGYWKPNALCRQPGYRAHMEKRRELRKKMGGESHSFKEWLDLKTEYQYSCAHCGSSEPEIKLTRDHIVPLSKGGTDGIDNIQPLCLACNMSKGTKIFAYAGNQSGS